jgi:hypothetical protein
MRKLMLLSLVVCNPALFSILILIKARLHPKLQGVIKLSSSERILIGT